MLRAVLKPQYCLAGLILFALASTAVAAGGGVLSSETETVMTASVEQDRPNAEIGAQGPVLSAPAPSIKELTNIYGNMWLKGTIEQNSADEDTATDDNNDDGGNDEEPVTEEASIAGPDEADALVAEDLPEVPVVVNKQVEAYLKYFQTRGRKHFEKWLSRSQQYMGMITDILSDEGLPEDLFYIAFIESGLSPVAKSRARAVGIWQFIQGTAKKYGLRVDWWIDERRDPEKSTRAAAKYFRNLYDIFGSWYLAAAGYNAGEGRILKAIKRSNSDDFWVIADNAGKAAKKGRKHRKKALKKETRDYVPKYLAAMMIAKDPASYGFDAQMEADAIRYDKVTVPTATDLSVIADAAGTSVDEIKRLNPELLRWFTPPNYPDYELKIPAGKAAEFAENMGKVPPPKRIRFLEHKIKRGESVGKIAKRYGISVKPILYLNNLKNARAVRPGTVIVVPVRAAEKGKNSAQNVVTRMELNG